MRDATEQIELLGATLIPILDTPGVPELLAAKATSGCNVRILVADPGRHLAPLPGQPGIKIRVLEDPAHETIHRFDEQLLLMIKLLGQDAEPAPLLHLRRAATGRLFDRLAEHYNNLWEHASEPIEPDLDLDDADRDEHEQDDDVDSAAPDVTIRQAEGVNDASAGPPRRWPRRPA
jgi:hypothetical protein